MSGFFIFRAVWCSLASVRSFWAKLLAPVLFTLVAMPVCAEQLSLAKVLAAANRNDLQQGQFQLQAQVFSAESRAASELPDPSIFAAVQNLPSDTFRFNQEPMTQLRVGISQAFPRGASLVLGSELGTIQSQMQQTKSKARRLMLQKQSTQAWLQAWYWQQNLSILDQDQVFLEQLQGFIQSLYQVGARSQSDLIGANLELVKLNAQRIEAKQAYQGFRQQINLLANEHFDHAQLSLSLPDLLQLDLGELSLAALTTDLMKHPELELLEQERQLLARKRELVAQDFKPAWGLDLSYGFRAGENNDGSDRPDFLSAGIKVQVPLFSDAKQTQKLRAAKQRMGAAQLKYDDKLSQMRFELENLLQQYANNNEQLALYEQDLLPMLETQALSALQSYQSDAGDFSRVIALYLKQQRAKTKYQKLRVEQQILLSSVNYMLALDALVMKSKESLL